MESIFERMREDHRRVLNEVAAMEEAMAGGTDPTQAVSRLVALLVRQFGSHMAAEDEVLYPALMNALPETRASIEPLRADHGALRMMLADLEEMLGLPGEARDEQMAVQIRDLVDLLRIHIRKEEALVIGVAERVLQPAEVEALSVRMNRGPAASCELGPRQGPSKGVTS
ncbi:MAG TPA: hemerythrin domain-containing protein [Candidatus Eisenbacteria bacterium]|jgi:hemerythrin-like domain-containing protein|nr:hemerythrin domain-containing protein [Candidatus Eisenbacteria bacterium]